MPGTARGPDSSLLCCNLASAFSPGPPHPNIEPVNFPFELLTFENLEPLLAAAKEESGPSWIATVTKVMVLCVSAPMWIPILKELWKEVNESLAEEGGVFGDIPNEEAAKAINLTRNREGKSMVSVLMADRDKDGGRGGSTRRKSATRRSSSRRSF